MRTESLLCSSLPVVSRLFLDYQTDATSLRRFYPSAVDRPADVTDRVGDVLAAYSQDRDELCDLLRDQNLSFGASPETLDSIELLRATDTVAVLSGQQTGLFSGPLYSVYKALTAVKMAECLRSDGTNAVPVFWMATEDHDLAEVSNAFVVDSVGKLSEERFAPVGSDEGLPVGNVLLNDSVVTAIDRLFDSLPRTEFSEELRSELRKCWMPGKNFGEAFGSFFCRLLGKFGLVIVDPLDSGLKRMAAPLYVEAIRRSNAIVSALTNRSSELTAAGYHSQVLIEDGYFPLFWHSDNGVRIALRRTSDGRLQAKGRRERFTEDELVEIAAAEPGRFSPGVMLRPVVQDHLFPTICYFGGSAEVAYFAQNSEVYRILGRPVTTIIHRQSLTIVEPKHARSLEKYGLNFNDLFAGEDEIIRRVLDEFVDPATAQLFSDIEEKINAELERLDEAISKLDPTLAENLATRRRKINYHVGALRKKYYSRRAVTEEVIDRRVKAALTALLPDGQLQERVVNIVSFLDRFGPGFVDWIYDSIDLEDKGHRVIYI